MLEQNFMTSMIKADGVLIVFFERPIAAALGVTTVLIWGAMLWRSVKGKPTSLSGVAPVP
jgi:TctA family transporter